MSARSTRRTAKQLKIRQDYYDAHLASESGYKRPGSRNRKKGMSVKDVGAARKKR